MENQLKAELRIGNALKFWNNIFFVSEITELKITAKNKSLGIICEDYIEFSPITLTEDILLRLGFDEGFHRYGLENCGLKCHKSLKENYWIVSQGFGIQFTELTEIQFLHQLQNLFFSLCGEELTFKKW